MKWARQESKCNVSKNPQGQLDSKLLGSVISHNLQMWWGTQKEQKQWHSALSVYEFKWNSDSFPSTVGKSRGSLLPSLLPISVIHGGKKIQLISWDFGFAPGLLDFEFGLAPGIEPGSRNITMSLPLSLIIPYSSVQMVEVFYQVSDNKLWHEITQEVRLCSSFPELKIFFWENKTHFQIHLTVKDCHSSVDFFKL